MNRSSAPPARFGRDVIIAGLANLVRSLRNLLLIPLFTGYLSIAHYGEWELLTTAVVLLIPWATCGLNSALLRFLPGKADPEIREGFYSIFFFVLLSSGAFACALWALSGPLGHLGPLAPLELFGPAIAAVLVSSSLLSLVQSYFRAFRQMLSHSALNLAQNFGELLLIAYLLQHEAPIVTALWALGLTRGLLLAIGLLRIIATMGFARPKFTSLGEYLAYALPQIPNSMFYRLYDSADRFFLYAFIGSAAVGTYAAAYMAGSLFTTLISPIHTVLFPAMAALWNQGKSPEIGAYLTQTIRISALIVFPALAGAAIIAEPLMDLLIRDETGPIAGYYLLLATSFVVFAFGIPCGDLLLTAGQNRRIVALNGGLAVANLVLNLMLVPALGLWGAIASTLACHLSYTALTGYWAGNVVEFSVPWQSIIRALCATLIMALILLAVFGTQNNSIALPVVCGSALYMTLLFAFRALTRKDVEFLVDALGFGNHKPSP